MDVRRLEPTDSYDKTRIEFYPSSATGHYRHLIIAMVLTTLHLTPVIITNPNNHDAIVFAQPYITKWLMTPYAVYYTVLWHCLVEDYSWEQNVGSFFGGSEAIIIEPRTIMRNLRLGQITYSLSGSVMMWDVLYLWFTYIVLILWDTLPPYSFGDLAVELHYLLVAVGVIVSLLLGPVLVVSLVVWGGWMSRAEVIKVKELCRVRLEREKGPGEGKKGP